jgi:hypothetical protein
MTMTTDHDVFGFETHGLINCPACAIHLSNGVGVHGDEVNGKPVRHETNQFCCLGCGEEFGPAIRRRAASANNGVGVSLSWKVKEVRAARSERTAVRVVSLPGAKRKVDATFKSVPAAYRALGLDLNGHQAFRALLKANGTAVNFDLTWTVVA